MKIHIALLAALLLLGAPPLRAEDKPTPNKGAATRVPAVQAPQSPARAKGKLKPVDINSATKNELGFMLGIPEDLAAKIVAGRPYRSKAHLLTRHIVSAEVYAKIKGKVIAKQ
jgi:DNA uptake protein ComE-like DNA-binding protein